MQKKLLLYQCLTASLLVHGLIMWSFHNHIWELSTPRFSEKDDLESIPLAEEDIALSEKNISLEQAFHTLTVIHKKNSYPRDLNPISYFVPSLPKIEKLENKTKEIPSWLFQEVPIPAAQFLEKQMKRDLKQISFKPDAKDLPFQPPPPPPYKAPEPKSDIPHSDFSFHKMVIEAIPFASPTQAKPFAESFFSPNLIQADRSPFVEQPAVATISMTRYNHHSNKILIPPSKEKNRSPLTSPKAPSLGTPCLSWSQYQLPEAATFQDWSDHFSVSVTTRPLGDGTYFFTARFKGDEILRQYKLKQNYYFLIDRSHSLQPALYLSFKKGILKALPFIPQGDAFNIAFFDRKATLFDAVPKLVSQSNQTAATAFVAKQQQGSSSASIDLCRVLGPLMPQGLSSRETHAAILLSEGKTTFKATQKEQALESWLKAKPQSLRIHSATIGKWNPQAVLNTISSLAGGSFVCSTTHAAFPRKLAKLILNISCPIMHEVRVSASVADPEVVCTLHPQNGPQADIYLDEAFILSGVITKPVPISITIEGRNRDDWISIKKTFDWSHAKINTSRSPEEDRAFNAYLNQAPNKLTPHAHSQR